MSCIKIFDNVKKQKIYEALIILKERPSINWQNEDFQISWNFMIDLFSNVNIKSWL